MSSHCFFDRSLLRLNPLRERIHDLQVSTILTIDNSIKVMRHKKLRDVAKKIISAKKEKASIILMIGAHVLRAGVQRYIIDLMERGYLSLIAMNGAGVIHDFEFSLIGATTESVSKYISEGQFGLWKETGIINDIVNQSYKLDCSCGMGEAVGKYIEESSFPYKAISVLAAAWRLGIPVTVHIGIGYDIIHEHPNFDGASAGALSYNDFLIFASYIKNLEHGVVMNFGSAVMAPEVYLKALSMARNVVLQEGKEINHFATLVCDLVRLPAEIRKEPSRSSSNYYFRPFKTMLVRTVADSGMSFYVRGRHETTIPTLWSYINEFEMKRHGQNS